MEKKTIKSIPVKPPGIFSFSFKIKCCILTLIGLAFYFNSLWNGHAMDDNYIISSNLYVQNGFSGLEKIMTTDAYDGYCKEMNVTSSLPGGRYRPVSEIIFAIEHAIFGEPMGDSPDFVRHFVNIVSFITCVLLIFYFLANYLLKKFRHGEDIAFLATLLFTIHPIHTEVVANVKSLDEILSMLFIMLTFIFTLKYCDTKKPRDLFIGAGSYLLALLSKEYAISLVFLLPMLIYLLRYKNMSNLILTCVPCLLVFMVYLFLRGNAVGFHGHIYSGDHDILNEPFLWATHAQKIATKYFVLLKYLGLLFLPYPLISDYSYAQIPYQNFSNIFVLLSLLITYGMILIGIILLLKKNILAFPVWFYLLNLFLVSNFVMDIGATMGERLIFHSSLGFVILLSYSIFRLTDKWKTQIKRVALISLCSLLTLACGYETINRNAVWKSDITLATNDVHYGTNSIILNGNAGTCYITLADMNKDTALLDTAMRYLRKSIELHKGNIYPDSYMNMGVAYFQLRNLDSAMLYWGILKENIPVYPGLAIDDSLLAAAFLDKGVKLGQQKNNLPAAIREIKKAIQVRPDKADFWYNLGGAYFTEQNYDSAHYAWEKALELNPNYTLAKQGLSNLKLANPK